MKNHFLKTCCLAILLFLLQTGTVSGIEDIGTRHQHLHIRQEHLKENGVLISRPLAEDQEIIGFMNLNKIRNLEDYARWIAFHLEYRKDASVDHWAAPDSTIKSRTGDCEDFAFLTSAVVRIFGYKPHFIAMKQGKRAHAVCAFQKDGYYFWFDNAVLKNTSTRSLPELIQHLANNYRYSLFYELDVPTQRWKLLLKKS